MEIDSEARFECWHIRFSQYMEDNLQLEFIRFGTFINIMFKYIANVLKHYMSYVIRQLGDLHYVQYHVS